MTIIWLGYSLILTLILIGVSLTQAHTVPSFLTTLLLLPLFPTLLSDLKRYSKSRHRTRPRPAQTVTYASSSLTTTPPTIVEPELVMADSSVQDVNRRLFLRLAGSTSALVFFLAVFGQKSAKAAFFGSVPGPGTVALKDSNGDTIDPAAAQPTDGYEISEVDDTAADAYYGFVHKSGAWHITKETSAGAYRYAKGASNFAVSWALRATLTYDYFDNVF